MIPLGYELGTGRPISIPPAHTIFLGQTQRAGKSTALEACAVRSGFSCLAFLTKRLEQSFRTAREIAPYYSEKDFDWESALALCEALTGVNFGTYQRQTLIMMCEEGDLGTAGKPSFVSWPRADSLEQLEKNISLALPRAAGRIKLNLIEARSHLRTARRQLERVRLENREPALEPGLNVVNLEAERRHIQALVISGMINHVRRHLERTIICLPETWKFVDTRKRTPVGEAAREFIREAAAAKNFLWIDSQTLAGLSGELLSQVRVWMFGNQRHRPEIDKVLDAIPDNLYPRPSRGDIQQLKVGHFALCYDGELVPVYVRPVWMLPAQAQAIALGEEPPESARAILEEFDARNASEQ